jgi:hypothetical protein
LAAIAAVNVKTTAALNAGDLASDRRASLTGACFLAAACPTADR